MAKLTLCLATFLFCLNPTFAKTSYLYIGDSHSVGLFGHTLDNLLRADSKISIVTVASCGSSTMSWIEHSSTRCGYFEKRSPTNVIEWPPKKIIPVAPISELLTQIKPEVVIVALGSNQVINPSDFGIESIKKVLTLLKANAKKCYWIGPPQARVFPIELLGKFYLVLSAASLEHGCTLIDSRSFAQYPSTGGDGMHFDSLPAPANRDITKSWAANVFQKLK